MEKRRVLGYIIRLLLGVAVIWAVCVTTGNYSAVKVESSREFFVFLCAAFFSQFLAALLAGLALFYACGGCERLLWLLVVHFAGYLMAEATPGRIGYFGLLGLVKEKLRLFSSIAVVQGAGLLTRLAAVVLLLAVAPEALVERSTAGLLVLPVLVLTGFIALLHEGLWARLRGLAENVASRNLANKLEEARTAIIEGVRNPRVLLLVLLSWPFTAMRWYFSALAVGIDAPFPLIMAVHPIVYVAAFVPLTPGGLGVVEAAGTGLLAVFGYPSGLVLVSLLLDRLVEILVSLPFGVYVALRR